MDAAAAVLAWGGAAAHVVAWILIRTGRSIWLAMAGVLGPVGVLVLAVASPGVAERVSAWVAAGIGVAAGGALYAGTAAFMYVARRWPLLSRDALSLYGRRTRVPPAIAVALAALVVAPGEELLWRGVVQETLGARIGEATGALAAWGAYVGVNVLSGSIPIVLGAVVGGATWGALALATGGVVAPIVCHAVWTALMVVVPPVFSPEGRRA